MADYLIVKELKSDTRIFKKITLTDLFIVSGFTFLGLLTQNMVSPSIKMVYLIFNFLVGCFCTTNSTNNRGKKMIISLLFAVKRNKTVYLAFETEKKLKMICTKEALESHRILKEEIERKRWNEKQE
ncbi:MAG: DUF5592 family protein [Acutalibacteraceae bacterium]|nr:DUF5592 family protein [Acutalibacteraceae bacterium]MEE1282299.1 DUF5592 family protein [Acutalibacteraceae bacterium]